jgi:hypothetical protein
MGVEGATVDVAGAQGSSDVAGTGEGTGGGGAGGGACVDSLCTL